MSQAAKHYTAAEIARALSRQRQSVARALQSVRADGLKIVCGQSIAAWSFVALPVELQNGLETAALRLGFRNAETLLAAGDQAAAAAPPPCALADLAPASLAAAARLQRALAGSLARQHDPALSAAEWEAMGIADYAREIGHPITGRHLRDLVKRTLARAHAYKIEDFNSLILYVARKPALKTAVPPALSLAAESTFQELRAALASFKNPAAPGLEEKSWFWLQTFEVYESLLAEGKSPKKLKRALLAFLERHAPFLVAANSGAVANTLRVNFDRKYKKWLAEDRAVKALRDGRAENSGFHRAPDLSAADRDKLIAHAVTNCGGRVAQAWRELVQSNDLSEKILFYYLANPSRKSYVPRQIAESVKYEVAAMYDIHHGPRQHKLNGAYLDRDWSGVAAGDWFQADDVTFPVYMLAADGTLMRGQTLLMIDLRSTRILGFVLLSSRNYNANSIRTLITKVADQYGLPRKGFYLENGPWRAKILKGTEPAGSLSLAETELGLREFGLEFIHARLPRAKPIERIMNATQNLMEGLPGYVGRNEMTEKFERVQKLKREAESGKISAAGQFMDENQWAQTLADLCAAYNAAPQNGKMTGGLSPNDAFDQFNNLADPPIIFSAACRYLLATHRRTVTVTPNGITLRFGTQTFNYRNAETGKLRGQRMLAWFDPENPETLTVTDLDRKNPFCVERSQAVPAMDAPRELLAQEMGRIAEHQAHLKARYKVLQPLKPIRFRPMLADRKTSELGAEIGQQRQAIATRQAAAAAHKRRIQPRASRLGLDPNIVHPGTDGERGTEMMLQALQAAEKDNGEPNPNHG